MTLSTRRASIFCEGLDHPECVCSDRNGTLYTGGEAGQIYRISKDGKKVDQIACTGGFILGVAVSPDGRHLAVCDLINKCVWRLNLKTLKLKALTVAPSAAGGPLSIPNHLAFAEDGSLYVTDSGAFREVSGRIFKFSPQGHGDVWHSGPFNFANGIALSPTRDAVYLCSTWLPGVERVAIRPDGTAGRRTVYVRLPKSLPDGLAFDAAGNLYVSCYAPARIYKVRPSDRRPDVLIEDWECHLLSNPTNIAFTGENFDQLIVANLGRWHLTRLDLRAKGSRLPCHK